MSIDPNLAVGATYTGPTTFSSLDEYRIIPINLGVDSAVLGVSLGKPLVAAPNGSSSPLGRWKTDIIEEGYALELVTTSPQSGPLYANTTDDNRVVLGSTRQKFIFSGIFDFITVQDPKTKLVWELTRDGNSGDTYVITMKEKDPSNGTQTWGFKSLSLL